VISIIYTLATNPACRLIDEGAISIFTHVADIFGLGERHFCAGHLCYSWGVSDETKQPTFEQLLVCLGRDIKQDPLIESAQTSTQGR
jgi:hypothetical protein